MSDVEQSGCLPPEQAVHSKHGAEATTVAADGEDGTITGKAAPSGSSGAMSSLQADGGMESPYGNSSPCLSAHSSGALPDLARHAAGADDGSNLGTTLPNGDLATSLADGPASPQPGGAWAAPELTPAGASLGAAAAKGVAEAQHAGVEAAVHQEPDLARRAPGHPLTLEWLRDASEDAARDYLMGVGGALSQTRAALACLVQRHTMERSAACTPVPHHTMSWLTHTCCMECI